MTDVPKIKLTEWESIAKHGDPLDWLDVALWIVKINRGKLTDNAIVQKLVGYLTATELKMKIVRELNKLTPEETTIGKFEDIFKANVKRDTITYRNELDKLKYSEDSNMREFYSKISNLISKAMDLDAENDKLSIEKLACDKFISKLPNELKTAMQNNNYENGEAMADMAEKIRSYQRLYLPQKTSLNNFQNKITYSKKLGK